MDFPTAAERKAYRQWRAARALPMIRVLAAANLALTLAVPPIAHNLVGLDGTAFWLLYGVNAPMFAIGWALTYTRVATWGIDFETSAAAIAIGGGVFCYICIESLGSVGAAVAGSLIVAMFATLLRLSLVHTLAAMLPLQVPLAFVVASPAYGLPQNDQLIYLGILIIALILLAVLGVSNERDSRHEFATERRLARQQQAILRFLPQAVATQILEGHEADISTPTRRRVTILFADIAGFTDMADKVEPEVMTEVLGSYMSTMAGTIDVYSGTLNEFAGDGLMALFGAPETMAPEEQARCAVAAAQAMQGKMPGLNERWRKLGLGAELKIRIGINTGMASVGSYGSEGRMTYTAIGLQTNIAARIESAAEPGGTLISDATWQLMRENVECEPRGEVECKGVHFPVKVYAPKARTA